MAEAAAWDEPVVHPTYARLLCAVLRARGLDPAPALAALGMTAPALAKQDGPLTFAQLRRLILKAVEMTGNPALALELGPVAQPAAHGPVGYAAVASGDVAQALDVIARYGSERLRAVEFSLTPNGDFAVLAIRERFDFGDVRVFILETILVTIAGLLETIAGLPLDRAEFHLPYPAPAWAAEYGRYVKGAVHFDADAMQIRLPRDLLETPSVTADADAYESAQRECERNLAGTVGVALTVRRRIIARDSNYPTLEEVARELHMSARTLIRRLKEEGASYQDLLDEIRKDRAQWYLQHTSHSVEEIAVRLGYTDTTNFSRTCRRWFGMTPREIRQGN